MAHAVLVTLFSPDQKGLVAAVTGRLFDLGANLADTSFAVLGEGAEFTSVVHLPDEVSAEAVTAELVEALPSLVQGRVTVQPFTLGDAHTADGRVTHRVECAGADQPGLVARLSEVFGDFDANIVRLTTERMPEAGGATYVVRFAVNIPAARADSCLAALGNTAGGLRQSLRWMPVEEMAVPRDD